MKNTLMTGVLSAAFAVALMSAPVVAGETVTSPPDATQSIMGDNTLAPSGTYNASGGKSNSLSGNTVTLNSGTVDVVLGALNTADSDSATGNSVIINGGTVNFEARGAYTFITGAGNTMVKGNSATMNGSSSVWLLNGGTARSDSGTATAANNSATVNNGTATLVVAGSAISNTGNTLADNNSLTIAGGTLAVGGPPFGYVTAGDSISTSGTATSTNNTTTMTGGTFGLNAIVYGGSALSTNGVAAADSNTVIMSGGTAGSVVGGYAISQNSTGGITANGNSVTVTGGNINNVVMGGQAGAQFQPGTATASGNTVTLTGGTFGGDIRGGYAFTAGGTGIAQNNTVTIGGTANLSASNIYGGLGWNGTAFTAANDASVWKGNTLNVKFDAAGNTVAGVYNFENYNFYLPATMTAGQTMLTVSAATDITGSKIGVAINGGSSALNVGDTITLMNAAGGLTSDQNGTRASGIAGISKIFEFDLSTDGNNLYAHVAQAAANDQTKALSEGQLAGLSFLNQGADLISRSGVNSAMQAAQATEGSTGFVAMGGGSQRYITGSHVDVRGFSVMAGLAKKMNETFTMATFIEGGWGNYDSYNSLNAAPSVKGDGSTSYYGLGFLGRYEIDSAWYGEGSVRVGQTKTSFNSSDFTLLSNVSYDTSALYAGAHAGAGWLYELNEQYGLDLSAKLFYTYQGGDSVNIAGDNVDFNAANSVRTRLGGRVKYALKKNVTPYAGAFLDYEFEGKAKALVNGTAIDSPELKGATGVGEIGLGVIPSENLPLTLDIGLQGYAGTRRGFSASLQARYTF